ALVELVRRAGGREVGARLAAQIRAVAGLDAVHDPVAAVLLVGATIDGLARRVFTDLSCTARQAERTFPLGSAHGMIVRWVKASSQHHRCNSGNRTCGCTTAPVPHARDVLASLPTSQASTSPGDCCPGGCAVGEKTRHWTRRRRHATCGTRSRSALPRAFRS